MASCDFEFLADAVRDSIARLPLIPKAYRFASRIRARSNQATFLRLHGPIQTVTVGRTAISLDLREMHDFIMWSRFASGSRYESGTVSFLQNVLSEGKVFVDVGANQGYFTLLASPLVGDSGLVYAFEPAPRAYSRLQWNLSRHQLHRNIVARRTAISDHLGEADLFTSDFEDGLGSLVASSESRERVKMSTLDNELHDRVPDVVKMDVEGSELPALQGMRHLLKRNPDLIVVVEWNRYYSSDELWEFLSRHFRLFRICETSEEGHLRPIVRRRDLRGIGNLACLQPRFEARRSGVALRIAHTSRSPDPPPTNPTS